MRTLTTALLGIMSNDIRAYLKTPTLWARIQVRFFDELPQEGVGDIKLGLKVYGKQGSFKS